MKLRPPRAGHIAIGYLVKALAEPRTVEELVSLSGLCTTTVRHYILTWRKIRAVRIGEWQLDRRGRMTLPAYVLGNRPDAVRQLVPFDNAARMRAVYARDKAHRDLMRIAA